MKNYRGNKKYNKMIKMLIIDKKDFRGVSAKLISNKNINI